MADTNQRNTEESKIMDVVNRSQKTVDNGTKKYSSPIRYEPLKKEKNEVKIEYEPIKKEQKKEYEIYKTKGITKAHEKYKADILKTKGIAKVQEKNESILVKTKGRAGVHRENDQLNRISDPYTSHRFKIEIDKEEIGGFSEISAIEISSEIGEYYEGGQNIYPYHYIKKTKYSNITLKKGMTDNSYLWDWYQNIIMGKIEKRDVAIIAIPNKNVKPKHEIYNLPQKMWVVMDAFPVKWSGSAFNAGRGEVLIESLELAHNGIFIL